LEILLLDAKTEGMLDSFLFISLSNPYEIYGVNQDTFVKFTHNEIFDIVSKGGYVFVAKDCNQLVGLISLVQSDWDSKHFGIQISKISHLISIGNYYEQTRIKRQLISILLARCSKGLLLHISARVNKEDLSSIHALESNNFKLMDVLVTYSIDLRKDHLIPIENHYNIRKSKPDEISNLVKIAFDCFEKNAVATDRFHADPTLPKEKSSDLYAKWLENSINDPNSEVLVAEIDGKPMGFNICSINASLSDSMGLRFGTMTLTAVDSSYRHKLIAVSLLNASLIWFAKKVDVVDTGGQVSNYLIQRAWNFVGLKITRAQCTFHWSILAENI
jgi:RimJ/RimL family protein N-acetyltransferase